MLARFERLMEQAVEGSLRRVFPTTLQPVQLAKAAARAMEEAQVIGLRGAQVPNRYRLRLAPADLERFGDYTATLARELSTYLVDYAHERGLRPIAAPTVELLVDPPTELTHAYLVRPLDPRDGDDAWDDRALRRAPDPRGGDLLRALVLRL